MTPPPEPRMSEPLIYRQYDEILKENIALTQRAEAAEALNVRYEEIYNNSSEGWIELRKTFGIAGDEAVVPTLIAKFKQQGAERDALRKVDDAMVERAANALAIANGRPLVEWGLKSQDAYRTDARAALDAALAVQPTTEGL